MAADLIADLARAAQYAGAVLPFGGFVFLLAVARPACRGYAARDAALARLRGQLLRLAKWGLAAALLAMLAWLWTTAAGMSGEGLGAALSPALLATVVGQTRFGEVWCLRLGLAALLALLLRLCGGRRRRKPNAALDSAALAFAGAFLATIALAGHAFAEEGWGRIWHLAADLLHLLGAGAWLGALPLLALLLAQARKEGSPTWLALARDAVPRFSAMGIVSVAVIILSGIANSWFLVGTVPAFFGTAYGQVLLLKLALFLLMLGFAATNRWHLTPALRASSFAKPPPSLTRLCRNAGIEAGLGLAILLVVGILVGMTPAAHEQPVWPLPVTLDGTDVVLTGKSWAILIASAALAIAALAFGIHALYRGHWLRAALALPLVLIGVVLALRPFVVEAYPTTYFRSPLPYDAAAIAQGLSLYQAHCAACHGADGYGDGPRAAALPVKPADLTAHALHHGEGTLFWWVSHGIPGTPMPGFADTLGATQRWRILAFLRAQAEAEQAADMGSAVEPFRPLVAPGFAFQIEGRPQETLAAQRDQSIVLLVLYTLPDSLPRLRALAALAPHFGHLGFRIVALPIGAAATPAELGPEGADAAMLAAPNPDAVATYGLFRRDVVAGVPPMPPHMEFLIDRAGYLRARWSPGDTKGWRDTGALLAQISRLDEEPSRAAAPSAAAHHQHH